MPTRLSLVTNENQDELARVGKIKFPLLERVFDASPNCIKVLDFDSRLIFLNQTGRCLMEFSDESQFYGKKWADLWPIENRELVVKSIEQAKLGSSTSFEAFCPTAKGTARWWDVYVAPIKAGDQVTHIVSVSRDISERKLGEEAQRKYSQELYLLSQEQRVLLDERDKLIVQQELLAQRQDELIRERDELLERQQLLMREVDHRMKNSLALVASLLRTQARNVNEEAKSSLLDAVRRISLIGDIHDRLHRAIVEREVDLKGFVTSLCQDLESSAPAGTTVRAFLEDHKSTSDEAIGLGLAISELVTNAVKHGLREQPGTIEIRVFFDGGQLTGLQVDDSGSGVPDGFNPAAGRGLGMRLVRAQALRMVGTLSFGRSALGGASFRIERKA